MHKKRRNLRIVQHRGTSMQNFQIGCGQKLRFSLNRWPSPRVLALYEHDVKYRIQQIDE